MMDSKLLGETTAKMMDWIEESEDEGEVVAVGIVVICEKDGMTKTKTFNSDTYAYRQVGIFQEALEVIRQPTDDHDEDEEDNE